MNSLLFGRRQSLQIQTNGGTYGTFKLLRSLTRNRYRNKVTGLYTAVLVPLKGGLLADVCSHAAQSPRALTEELKLG